MNNVLFLLKTNLSSGGSQVSKSGLYNSARFIVDAISKLQGVTATLQEVANQNHIAAVLTYTKPDMVIIEAVWIVPSKLQQLVDMFPHIRFITRLHSRVPFIAMEGNVIEWIKQYGLFSELAFNNKQTANDMYRVGIKNIYLPNIYPNVELSPVPQIGKKHHYKIGCFGSIRPFKNQLAQAFAAILFAEKRNAIVHFYINTNGIEQNGNSVLKNIRALFADTRHRLIEIGWLPHDQFISLLRSMDACMQVSYTETFNLTTADAILAHVPVVVSDQIDWLTCRKANPNNESDIAEVLEYVIDRNTEQVEDNISDLLKYNHHANREWFKFLMR